MKKTLLTATFLVAGAVGLMAQGLVSLDNEPFNWVNSIENGGTEEYKIYQAPGVLVDSASWSAQLYENGNPVGAAIPFYSDYPGVIDIYSDPDTGARPLSVAGGTATMLEVWVFNSGVFAGKSAPFSYTPPTSATPAPSDLFMNNFRGFVVPEPSTIALGVLGLGALLVFRRRK
jgi:hypothetical protein